MCPPVGAIELAGTVYRFINGRGPVDNDFMSHYERSPKTEWGGNACKARGLSIVRTWADCSLMRAGVPALRKKRIAVAEVTTTVGLVANTPSQSCAGHCTWWRNPSPEQVRPLFAMFDEPSEVANG
jgi:hypothetical protein